VLSGRTHHGMRPERPNTEAIALHDKVARAIRLQDEVAAEKAMRAIIDEAAAAVTEEFCRAEQSTSSPSRTTSLDSSPNCRGWGV
jgi:DNA-binding FadR family transcriptional regulator